MAAGNNGAVFFLGSRAHYEVLEPPNNYDIENGNTSTETIYQNQSVEELWPNEQTNKHTDFDANYNPETINWNYCDQNNTVICESNMPVSCVKRRVKRRSSETLLCDEKPTIMNAVEPDEHSKSKPTCRVSLLSFLASLARRKRSLESEQVQYLQHFESALTSCTYRESCRCLDCQLESQLSSAETHPEVDEDDLDVTSTLLGLQQIKLLRYLGESFARAAAMSRYFECEEESDEYSSDDDYASYNPKDIANQAIIDLDDDVFIANTPDNDNTSTDLLLDDQQEEEQSVQEPLEDEDTDKQLQMEVAASTSAMFNILLYHPFSCAIQ
ncbi:uncharacterized protein LOC124540935 [Vanessa cardui]|uniref:uncharacterized protein LOC124540935 n=1 Tax=Vanessa cardui TaxID=171605 RepID=UPI001F12CFCA|nr:uncharacterized protein LOC124540935 [Vanessa cardui]